MKLIDKLKLLRDKASIYSNLNNNTDFNEWRQEIVEKRLSAYLKKVIESDIDTNEGKLEALNNLKNYQQLSFICKDIFKVWQFTENEAIRKIQENDTKSQPEG
jgi:hypothetical protein